MGDAQGVPLGLTIAEANRHDMKLLAETLRRVVITYPMPLAAAGIHLCLDKGYDFDQIRELLDDWDITAHIRSRGEEAEATQEPGKKARRWVIERTHSWLNRFRGLLIRWTKKPKNYLGLLHFACGLIAFRYAGFFG